MPGLAWNSLCTISVVLFIDLSFNFWKEILMPKRLWVKSYTLVLDMVCFMIYKQCYWSFSWPAKCYLTNRWVNSTFHNNLIDAQQLTLVIYLYLCEKFAPYEIINWIKRSSVDWKVRYCIVYNKKLSNRDTDDNYVITVNKRCTLFNKHCHYVYTAYERIQCWI